MAAAGIRWVEVSASSFKHFGVTYVARALGATIDLKVAAFDPDGDNAYGTDGEERSSAGSTLSAREQEE